MARVLIIETSDDLRNLVAHIVTRLGHEPVAHDGFAPEVDTSCDLVLVEPGAGRGLAMLQALRASRPDLPVVCVSHFPPEAETEAFRPLEHLMKPFRVSELQAAVSNALAAGPPSPAGPQPAFA